MLFNSLNKTIRINPHLIENYTLGPNWWWFSPINKRISNVYIKEFLRNIALGRLYYGGDWDLKSTNFSKTHWFLKVDDFRKNINNIENSSWYKSIMKEITLKGHYLHKKIKLKNKEDVFLFFSDYVIALIESLRKKNFIKDSNNDIPSVYIGRNGELIKSGHGCHRLAIIKSFNINCDYPIQITGIHKKFYLKGNKPIDMKEINDYVVNNFSST